MGNILRKEFKLTASVLSYLFIIFGLMFFLPGYPILCGVFFTTLGIFKSFQNARETNDILFSALLPIAKRDVVKGKYLFVCFIELCSLIIMGFATVMRMTLLSNSYTYKTNSLMNANFFALGLALLIFGLFNLIFVGGFFKTAYKFGKPFFSYIIVCFIIIFIGESLHHFEAFNFLNAFGTDYFYIQLLLLITGIVLYVFITFVSYKKSCKRFENIDL